MADAPSAAVAPVVDRARLEGAFVYCAACSAAHRITRSDRAAAFLDDATPSVEDDYGKFVALHDGHPIEVLWRSSDAEQISHPRWDPMCRVAWEVSTGEQVFVVTFGRTDLEEPRQYVIVPGRMVLDRESIDIDAELLRRVFDEAIYPHAAPHRKIDAIVETCRRLVAATPTDALEPLDESRDDPNVQLACLPYRVATALAKEARRKFFGADATRIVEAIESDLRHTIPIVRWTRLYRIEGR